MGFLELLFLILLVLKLTGVIAISWFWVIAPMIPAIMIYAIVLFVFGGTLTAILAEAIAEFKRR